MWISWDLFCYSDPLSNSWRGPGKVYCTAKLYSYLSIYLIIHRHFEPRGSNEGWFSRRCSRPAIRHCTFVINQSLFLTLKILRYFYCYFFFMNSRRSTLIGCVISVSPSRMYLSPLYICVVYLYFYLSIYLSIYSRRFTLSGCATSVSPTRMSPSSSSSPETKIYSKYKVQP